MIEVTEQRPMNNECMQYNASIIKLSSATLNLEVV